MRGSGAMQLKDETVCGEERWSDMRRGSVEWYAERKDKEVLTSISYSITWTIPIELLLETIAYVPKGNLGWSNTAHETNLERLGGKDDPVEILPTHGIEDTPGKEFLMRCTLPEASDFLFGEEGNLKNLLDSRMLLVWDEFKLPPICCPSGYPLLSWFTDPISHNLNILSAATVTSVCESQSTKASSSIRLPDPDPVEPYESAPMLSCNLAEIKCVWMRM